MVIGWLWLEYEKFCKNKFKIDGSRKFMEFLEIEFVLFILLIIVKLKLFEVICLINFSGDVMLIVIFILNFFFMEN